MSRDEINYRAISDAARIRLLASPIRHELVDTLAALGGEASAVELALQLGRPADGLYYHLRLLCKANLIDEQEDEPGAERRYRLCGKGDAPLRLSYKTGDNANTAALHKFAHGLLQVAKQDFENALDTPGTVVEGPQRQLWAARNKGWLSSEELREANTLLERLCELMSNPRTPERNQLMSCAFVLAPVTPRPIRRTQDE
ncbi:winged helix-turn-helix domain-containing protein [Pseudoduganella namucuonensis]|uniref:Helix-turn-helix domain-containing protein n=1 Tax=Pseudoduganella namucuonensis TaxID=1035707 RepID=A0A1I7KWM3_9BURK|nr:helix-turn-helix domain-containing protein [Pseudoduganella namucuonensis]SFV01768.1 Helix-turn-helix domain-containing protein [Pseudoduganella namucuonensis]